MNILFYPAKLCRCGKTPLRVTSLLNIKFKVMETNYSEETKKNFLTWIVQPNIEDFFEEHKTEINYTIMGYKFLKETYENNGRFDKDDMFKSFFRSFYYMRYIKKEYADFIFEEMDNVMRETLSLKMLKLEDVTKRICRGESIQFSFITKLLNLKNDELFPIYDSKVALVFHFKELMGTFDEKIKELCVRYDVIRKTYENLLNEDKTRYFLTMFNGQFKEATTLSGMRILDIVFWQKGKYIDENV